MPPGETPNPPPTPELKRKYEHGTYSTIIITSLMGEGSTSAMHGGTFTLNDDEFVDLDVVVKLSFSDEAEERLQHEYLIYQHLNSKGVKGIPTALGLFINPECDGPSALILTHTGQSIHNRTESIEYFQWYVFITYFYLIGPLMLELRAEFQTTLKNIHAAGVIHGNIRSPNLLIDEFGDTTIIDFDRAEKNESQTAQDAEFNRLTQILERKGR